METSKMRGFWIHYFHVIEDYRKKLIALVEEYAVQLDRIYHEKFVQLSEKLDKTIFLIVEEGDSNPFLIAPVCLILFDYRTPKNVIKNATFEAMEFLGELVSDCRLVVKDGYEPPKNYIAKYKPKGKVR